MTSQPQPNGGAGTTLTEKEPPYLSSTSTTQRASSDEEKQNAGVDSSSPAGEKDKERWNFPRTNIRRVGACFYSFIIMGANDAAYGVSLPRFYFNFPIGRREVLFFIYIRKKKGEFLC